MLCKLALLAAALAALSTAVPLEGGASYYHLFFRLADAEKAVHNHLRITVHEINQANTISQGNPVIHFNGTAPQVWHDKIIAEGTTDENGELFIEVPRKGFYIGLLHMEDGTQIPLIMSATPTKSRDRRAVGRRSVSLTTPAGMTCKDSQIVFVWDNNIGCFVYPMVYTPYNALSDAARLSHRDNMYFCPQPNQDPCPGTNGRRVWYFEDSAAMGCHESASSGVANVRIGENLQGYVYKAGYYEAVPMYTTYDNNNDLVTGFYMRGSNGAPTLILGMYITQLYTTYDNNAGQFYVPFKVEINSDCDVNNYGVGTVTIQDKVKCTPNLITGSSDTLPFEDSDWPRC